MKTSHLSGIREYMHWLNKLFIVFITLMAGGCCTAHFNAPQKALIDVPSIQDAINIETIIDAQGTNTAPTGETWFNVLEGSVPIIVTAPHATRPFREGKYRFSDGAGTAAVAILLHKLDGVTAIYTTYESPSDPNYYDDNDFKATLLKEIEKNHPVLLLDIHGSSGFRPYDVDMGTMNNHSLLGNSQALKVLVRCLKKEGLINLSGNYFSASDHQTDTKFASKHGVPAIQLEINSTWLIPSQGDLCAHRFAELLQALVEYVNIETGKSKD
jgi:hypothetical protein